MDVVDDMKYFMIIKLGSSENKMSKAFLPVLANRCSLLPTYIKNLLHETIL